MRPQWRGCEMLLCYAMPPPSTTITTQMEWEICLTESKLCRWEEEMTRDLFPLGHAGVALDWMETNRRELREEVFWRLKSGCLRWRTWLLVSTACVGTLWMIKMIAREIRHSCTQVHSVGGVLSRLLLFWTNSLNTTDTQAAWYRKCSFFSFSFFVVKYVLWF